METETAPLEDGRFIPVRTDDRVYLVHVRAAPSDEEAAIAAMRYVRIRSGARRIETLPPIEQDGFALVRWVPDGMSVEGAA